MNDEMELCMKHSDIVLLLYFECLDYLMGWPKRLVVQ